MSASRCTSPPTAATDRRRTAGRRRARRTPGERPRTSIASAIEYLDDRDKIERYAALAIEHPAGVAARPFGPGPGCVDDHVHLDLGYVTAVPTDAPERAMRRE